MEEMLGNVAGARQVFERWMKWEPDHNGWAAYIKVGVVDVPPSAAFSSKQRLQVPLEPVETSTYQSASQHVAALHRLRCQNASLSARGASQQHQGLGIDDQQRRTVGWPDGAAVQRG